MSQHIIGSLSLSVIRETHTRPVGVADSMCVRVCACLQAHVVYTEVRRPEDTLRCCFSDAITVERCPLSINSCHRHQNSCDYT